jgi:hypothetical protein
MGNVHGYTSRRRHEALNLDMRRIGPRLDHSKGCQPESLCLFFFSFFELLSICSPTKTFEIITPISHCNYVHCTPDNYFHTRPNLYSRYLYQGIYYSIGGPSPSACFPSGWTSTSQYFSPGLCPTGYTQACANVVAAGTVRETQATCCPRQLSLTSLLQPLRPENINPASGLTDHSGYACYTPTAFNFLGQACVSVILRETTTTVTNATNNQPMLATLHPKTEAVNGYGVSIRYQSTDFVSATSSSASSTNPCLLVAHPKLLHNHFIRSFDGRKSRNRCWRRGCGVGSFDWYCSILHCSTPQGKLGGWEAGSGWNGCTASTAI